jgi:hypothetical protein
VVAEHLVHRWVDPNETYFPRSAACRPVTRSRPPAPRERSVATGIRVRPRAAE